MTTPFSKRRAVRYAFVGLALIMLLGGLYIATAFHDVSSHNMGHSRSALDRIKATREINVGYIIFPPTVTKDLNNWRARRAFCRHHARNCQAGRLEDQFY